MAQILSDRQIETLLGSIITRGDKENIRPNSYILRLGSEGRFLITKKKFELRVGKGIKIKPGEAVAITSLEDIDFSQETVDTVFPGKQLHGFLTPTTDFAREGIVAAATQIDAGFHGTLNWTLSNFSSEETPIVYGTGIYRLTFFLLDKDEKPEVPYGGYYQNKFGYVSSQRPGPPLGMTEEDFETSEVSDDMSELFERLSKSSWPYNIIGQTLAFIDGELKAVSSEYQSIFHKLQGIDTKVSKIETSTSSQVKGAIDERMKTESLRLSLRFNSSLGIFLGLLIAFWSNPAVVEYVKSNGIVFGISILAISFVGMWFTMRS